MEEKTGRILIVDDDVDVLKAAKLYLKRFINYIKTENDPSQIPFLLAEENYDIILLDMNFTRDTTSGKEGFYWLSRIKEIDPDVLIVLITAYGDLNKAIEAIKKGATDFILKPWDNEKLLATILSGLKHRNSNNKATTYYNTVQTLSNDISRPFSDFIGESEELKKIFFMIKRVAETDANVLVLGENGTGKELVARAIHKYSSRKNNMFIGVDMGSINENLFESELFGYMKGAFTDAKENRAGRFELADKGSIFLDEIGNLPLNLQLKLLSVLQNREITRVGSAKSIPVDIRLICATNIELSDPKIFRPDLLYRINTVEIIMPPLRDRKDDIPILIDHFLVLYNKKYKRNVLGPSDKTVDDLKKYNWPGNIRELRHSVERAVILTQNQNLLLEDFSVNIIDKNGQNETSHQDEDLTLEQIEINAVRNALKKTDGNISKAAKKLGITRTSLYRRMEKYNI